MKVIIASILLPVSVLFNNPEIIGGSNNFQNASLFSKLEVFQTNQEKNKINYYKDRKTIASKGKELNGEKVGIWEFYSEAKELYLKYNYTTQEELFYSKNSTFTHSPDVKILVIQDGVEVEKTPDRFPVPIPPKKGSFIKSVNVNYPSEARKKMIEGTVKVSFIIDEKGNAKDFKVDEGIGGGCDEEALNKVRTVMNLFLPAIVDRNPVASKFIMPIRFSIK